MAVHVEGVARDAGDYRVGKGWAPEGEATRKVPGSFNRTDTGSVGLSWVGERGYLGAAYTRQTAKYGLPGHNHSFEGCHTHGNHLHCGAHAGEDDGHDHEDHDHGDVPVVDLRSERFDVRGELRNPFAGFSALRLRAGVTDYVHDEVEDGAVSTTFKNKAYDTRVELQHEPIAGFKGVVGLQTSQRKFSAEGEEAYVEPTVTRKVGLFVLEEYRLGDWRFEGALRHDRQTAEAQTTGIERSHNGTSASLGAVWRFTPGYQVGTSFTRASRAPSAEELYARGLHMATSTYERGNADLRAETSQNIDVSLKKTSGDTTFGVSVFHNKINHYIYGRAGWPAAAAVQPGQRHLHRHRRPGAPGPHTQLGAHAVWRHRARQARRWRQSAAHPGHPRWLAAGRQLGRLGGSGGMGASGPPKPRGRF